MLRVLTYHRILDRNIFSPETNVSATPSAFRAQMRYVLSRFDVVTIEDVLNAIAGQSTLSDDAVLITFDDAYIDFGEVAWPILRQEGIPVVLFVPTAYPGDPNRRFWWDRIKASILQTRAPYIEFAGQRRQLTSREGRYLTYVSFLRIINEMQHEDAMRTVETICSQLGEPELTNCAILSWDQLRELSNDGVALGAHTRTHPTLTKMSAEQVRNEIAGSREDLEKQVGYCVPAIAYPSGRHNDLVVKTARQEGFKVGFTTSPGHTDVPSTDPLRLPRTNIGRRTSMTLFRMRLSRGFGYVDEARHFIQAVARSWMTA